MLSAARALVVAEHIDVGDSPDEIVGEFRTRFHDTSLFDPKAHAKMALYLFRAHEAPPAGQGGNRSREDAHQKIEEAQMFIEAAHACYDRIQAKTA